MNRQQGVRRTLHLQMLPDGTGCLSVTTQRVPQAGRLILRVLVAAGVASGAALIALAATALTVSDSEVHDRLRC
jgi:hypothetical protein